MKHPLFLISLLSLTILVSPAHAAVTASDTVVYPDLLYQLIWLIAGLFVLIVWDARQPIVKGGLMNLEYFLRFIMGASSVLLSFIASSYLSNGSVISNYAGVVWSLTSQPMSIFFLFYGLIMAAYTIGMLLLFISERSQSAIRSLDHGRR